MQTLTLNHEKLGPITFQGEAENSLVYDTEIIKSILLKGISYFVSEELLTPADQSALQSFISQMEIGIDESLTSRSFISTQINPDNEVVRASYMIFSHTSQVPVVDMINTILDDLCQLIILVKHPTEELHGPNWVEYAEFLLPSEYINNTYNKQ